MHLDVGTQVNGCILLGTKVYVIPQFRRTEGGTQISIKGAYN